MKRDRWVEEGREEKREGRGRWSEGRMGGAIPGRIEGRREGGIDLFSLHPFDSASPGFRPSIHL